MNVNEIFVSEYLKAADLGKRRRTYTISGMAIEEIGKDNDPKPVLSFNEIDKRFVLNKTNTMNIASLLESDDTNDWVGHKITLRPDQTTFEGKPVACIRVDMELPEDAPPPPRKAPPTRTANSAVARNAQAAESEYMERPDDGSEPVDPSEIPF